MEEFDVTTYPEGPDIIENLLSFLPEDDEIRGKFMREMLQWFIQW